MRDLRVPAALFFTSSLFLIHCSSGEDPGTGNAGTSGTTGGGAGTTSGSAGQVMMGGSAGMGTGGSTGGSSGSTSGTAGKGGASGGQSGGGSSNGGAGSGSGGAGAGGRSMAGGGGMAAGSAGMPAGGMGGQSGSAGSGAGMSGGGMGGKAGGGMGGSSSGAMTLTSTAIMEGGMFPAANTCTGNSHQSPDLTWTAGPSGTMSYAIILLDTSNMLNHWVLWDIPASVTSLPADLDGMAMPATPAGAKQKAIQGNGYFGPCPNGQDHVYKFTVYALPVATLSGAMTSEMTSALAMDVMNATPLASASLSAHSSASM